MRIPDIWWTAPAEAENGRLIMVTGRDSMDEVRADGRYRYRITISWRYNERPDGMPDDTDAALMEEVTDALLAAFRRDKVAVMTGIYTGDGLREYVLYTKNLRVFGIVLNKALAELPTVPIVIDAQDDPDWEEYAEMRANTYIPPEED